MSIYIYMYRSIYVYMYMYIYLSCFCISGQPDVYTCRERRRMRVCSIGRAVKSAM